MSTNQFFPGHRIQASMTGNQLLCTSGLSEAKRILFENGVVLINNFPHDPEMLLEVGRAFGTLETVRPLDHRLDSFQEIRLQSTVKGKGIQGGGTYWHADSPWYDPPASATLLFCELAPASGGRTLFVDMRRFLEELNDELREFVSNAVGQYPCKDVLSAELSAMGIVDKELMMQMNNIQRPLVRTHPKTGTSALYLNEKWLQGICDERQDTMNKIRSLYKILDSYKNIQFHQWTRNDLLIWDNCNVSHKALPTDEGSDKTTWRAIVKEYH